MQKKTNIQLKCPRCSLSAEAAVTEKMTSFIIYTCPKCHANVVYYENKIDVISDSLLKKLIRNGKLQSCGRVAFKGRKRTVCVRSEKPPEVIEGAPPRTEVINDDDLLNLRIVLETMDDPNDIIKYI